MILHIFLTAKTRVKHFYFIFCIIIEKVIIFNYIIITSIK